VVTLPPQPAKNLGTFPEASRDGSFLDFGDAVEGVTHEPPPPHISALHLSATAEDTEDLFRRTDRQLFRVACEVRSPGHAFYTFYNSHLYKNFSQIQSNLCHLKLDPPSIEEL
jgi:hypothetical protein